MIKIQLHVESFPKHCFTMLCEYNKLSEPAEFSFYDWFDSRNLKEGPKPSDAQLKLFPDD